MSNVDLISFQLYSLRNYRGLAEQLQLLSQVGYRHVETTRRNYLDARQTRQLLTEYGMSAPTGHFMLEDLQKRIDWVVDVAKTIGIQQLVFPGPYEGESTFDIEAWRAKGRELGEVATRLEVEGLRFGFHNHSGEFALMPDGQTALDHLFAAAAGTPLGWQVDLGWMARAGVDAIPLLKQYSGKVLSCHMKDLAPSGYNLDEDGWTDVGHGVLAWDALWTAGRDAGAHWMIVEHDEPKRFEEFPRRSFVFLAALNV